MSHEKQKSRSPALRCGAMVEPDWHDICAAYEEAAEHLEICAGQAESESEKNAHRIVASRIRAAGNRVRPNMADMPSRPKSD